MSVNKVRDMANYINKFEGSHGAVRDLKEHLLSDSDQRFNVVKKIME